MVSDLASSIERILPFAKRALEDVLYDKAELLEPLVKKMYNLISETATFICGYVKRSPTSRSRFHSAIPELIGKQIES